MLADYRVDRRRWLQAAAIGSLGSGGLLMAVAEAQPSEGETVANDCRHPLLLGDQCPQILRFSKNLPPKSRIPFSAVKPCPCSCGDNNELPPVSRATFKGISPPLPSEPCDDPKSITGGELQIAFSGVLAVRIAPCPKGDSKALIGASCGEFTILKSDRKLFQGTFCGTEGFEPMPQTDDRQDPAKRCCQQGVGLGGLCGEGIGEAKGWLLKATYRTQSPEFDPRKLCEDRVEIPYEMAMDGVLIGPCRQS